MKIVLVDVVLRGNVVGEIDWYFNNLSRVIYRNKCVMLVYSINYFGFWFDWVVEMWCYWCV